ncbi:MAG: 50S ribosomal protein L13 [Bacteroidia bacterium]|nr:50S ribosomal protein L13 [Bacteroidia bacterium]
MDTLSYKTKSAKSSDNQRAWWVIDARDLIVGRLASEIAKLLRGKHKPYYTPHALCGDSVIIINADKVRFTGRKLVEKEYIHHTGYPGGQRVTTPKALLAKHPCRIMEYAIKGMLPKTKLGDKMYGNLYVYAGENHPHTAQNPQPYTIKTK